jgi:GTP-binding protein EngB required for normal cell division/tetratricopeptide (TPR) repeat protein
VNLAEVIDRWIGRVEVVLAGAEGEMREAEQALAAGDGMAARAAARRLLERAPVSPIGLALLVDACEAAHLEAELALTLEELARRAPSRAEVWVRLGRARRINGSGADDVRDALLHALAVAESGSVARVQALLALADLDLECRDGARAALWLARIASNDAAVAVRRAEACLLCGDPAGARALLEPIQWDAIDGRAALALGRARSESGDESAFLSLLRAYVLDEPGASEALSAALTRIPSDVAVRTRIRSIVDAKGEQSLARWHAAFAQAEGARDTARLALRAAVDAAEPGAATALLELSLEDHDAGGLAAALKVLEQDASSLAVDARVLGAAALPGDVGATLDAVATVSHPRVVAWAGALARTAISRWIPAPGEAGDWIHVLARLGDHARALGDPLAAATAARLAADRSSPVVLAVVGEFNAGKSTFINALVGEAVAPTGVLPTTAVLHHLRWAPDSLALAKIVLRGPGPKERIVIPSALRATLAGLDPNHVDRVEIQMPVALLARIEILDTPGFNADVEEHAAVAWLALDEADMAIWLVDATQAIKQSERRVLEEATRRKLPVQVLVNKADRLTRDEVARVLGSVNEGLASMGLASWRPPCAFSSKRALAGRLGDPEALRDSGWGEVQRLLDDGVVAQSAGLKDLSMRRRASVLVSHLVDGYRGRLAKEGITADRQADASRQAAMASSRIERDEEEVVSALVSKVEAQVRRWESDQSMIFVGRDARDRFAWEGDPLLERYRIDSALTTIAPTLLRELAAFAPQSLRGSLERGPLPSLVRATIRTAAACTPAAARTTDRFVVALCRAAVAALVEQLVSHSMATSNAGVTRTAGALRELEQFAAALE